MFTVALISYLIHLNDQDLPLPMKAQWVDGIVYILFAGFWVFTVWSFKNW
jgi:hypothetical protein